MSTGYKCVPRDIQWLCPMGYNPRDMCCPRGIDTTTTTSYKYSIHGICPFSAMDKPAIPWITFYIPWTTSAISRGQRPICMSWMISRRLHPKYIPWTTILAPTGYIHRIWPTVEYMSSGHITVEIYCGCTPTVGISRGLTTQLNNVGYIPWVPNCNQSYENTRTDMINLYILSYFIDSYR